MPCTKVLICSGFHRSATSVTANYLHNAGLDLGRNLMPAHISNPKGHFEDSEAVSLHDSFLQNSGTNWQFHDECELHSEIRKIIEYTHQRFEKSKQWGLKDPRICLFLDEWDQVLDDQGHYLLIVRHWSSCIESLLHRHSRELAHHMPEINANNGGLKFWLTPELAASMWLSYNKRLLAFAEKNRNKVLLVTQRALFEGAPIITFLNKEFGFELNEPAATPFDITLLRDQASESILNSLSYSMREKLDSIHSKLIALADFKSVNEVPVYTKANEMTNTQLLPLRQSIKQAIDNLSYSDLSINDPSQFTGSVNKINDIDWVNSFLGLSDEQTIKKLNSANNTLSQGVALDNLKNIINKPHSLNSKVQLAFAQYLMRIEDYTLAITYFQKTISLGVYFPYFDMLIAQCYQRLNLAKEATFFFDKAIDSNPKNPVFHVNKAIFLINNNQKQLGLQTFEKAYELSPTQPSSVLPYCKHLINIDQQEKAKEILVIFTKQTGNAAGLNMLNKLKPKINSELDKKSYLSCAYANMQSKNKAAWLAQYCLLISNNASEVDLVNRIYTHWNDFETALKIEK
jgi:tetratricopeptide (TPR) repeat protein